MPPPVPPSVNAGRMIAGRPIRRAPPPPRRGAPLVVRPLDDERGRVRLVDPVEQVAERLAVLGHADRLERRAQQPDVVPLEHAGLRERRREVQRRLAAEAGEQAVRLLAGDDRLDRVDRERLEVHGVGDVGSVMIVAGLELTRIVRTPSARSARHACVPA